MKRLLLVLTVFLFAVSVSAQELRCRVTVSASKIQGADRALFRSMQKTLTEFMNTRKWTDHVYENEERIECNIRIQFENKISSSEYNGNITVQLSRPVFNSSYKTTVLNIMDTDFRAEYSESQSLVFNENSNNDNLVNILAYYAYIILGFDYSTFSPQGGREYFLKAQRIVSKCQSSSETGWKAYESQTNRYWLVENLLNRAYSPFISCLYEYHRKGLDMMAENPQQGRANIANTLKNIQRIFRTKSTTYILQVFFDAKSDELVNIFKQSYSDEKKRVVAILNECDPSNADDYKAIEESTSSY